MSLGGELNHELQAFGLAATGGFVLHNRNFGSDSRRRSGMAGSQHGLALDNLLSVDVVTAEGVLLTATLGQNQDLFWGVRGGGGNLGIVTSFEFKVHPVGRPWRVSRGKEALQFWRDFESTAPEELTAGALVFNASADLPLPVPLKIEPIVAMGGV